VTDLFAQPDDATPLDAEEREGLLQTWITTRADLNEAEQANIDAAVAWTARRRDTAILTEGFVLELHKRMLGDVCHGQARRGKPTRISAWMPGRFISNWVGCYATSAIGSIGRRSRRMRSLCVFIMVSLPSIHFPMATAAMPG
jgi:hypothetical protein